MLLTYDLAFSAQYHGIHRVAEPFANSSQVSEFDDSSVRATSVSFGIESVMLHAVLLRNRNPVGCLQTYDHYALRWLLL
jgi:hypothetical protein